MGVTQLTSGNSPVTTESLAKHARIGAAEQAEESVQLQAFIDAATALIEKETRTAIMRRSYALSLDAFPCEPILLPYPPLASVTSISYVASDGETQTVPSSIYTVDAASLPGRIILNPGQTWPETSGKANAVTITYAAGLDNAPALYQQAILMLAGHWYANREAVSNDGLSEMPLAVQRIIDMTKVYQVSA